MVNGPQDVLATLLNNLKVQERQNRVCTTVAIAIVAETCAPFTVLPGLLNEYRIPELNVQNGVLKSLSFLFEYIGEMGHDYIYAVVPLLEDALMDRDMVHRQTACTTVKHMALGSIGLGCEDAMQHLLNLVWPNIFETSPHVINAVTRAIEHPHPDPIPNPNPNPNPYPDPDPDANPNPNPNPDTNPNQGHRAHPALRVQRHGVRRGAGQG